jgi:DNA-binding transcriptional ArsR family regulator
VARSQAARAGDVFRAVADPARRRMLELLQRGDLAVAALSGSFRMSQPAVSQHLKVLREAGLVRSRKAGRRRLYRLERAPLERVYEWVARQLVDPFGHEWSLAAPER